MIVNQNKYDYDSEWNMWIRIKWKGETFPFEISSYFWLCDKLS